jgi:hypothetical protein
MLAIGTDTQREEQNMTQEDWDEVEELEDARSNPQAYGLDRDGWPNAEEFNAAISEASGTVFDDQ